MRLLRYILPVIVMVLVTGGTAKGQAETNALFDHFFLSAQQAKASHNYQTAFENFMSCKRLNPDLPIVPYELAKIMMMTQHYDYAADFAEEAVSKDTTNNKYYLMTAILANKTAGRQEKNIPHFEKLIQIEPDDIEHYMNYYQLLIESKQYQKAMEVLNKVPCVNEMERVDVELRRAALYEQMNQRRKMNKSLKKLYKTYPNDARINSLLGYTYYSQGDKKKGLELARKAVTLAGGETFLLTLADMYRDLGMDSLYAETIEQAFASEQIEQVTKGQRFYEMLTSTDNMAKKKSWEPMFEKIMASMRRQYPDNKDFCVLRETYYSQNGRVSRAITELKNFVEENNSGDDYIWRKLIVQGQVELGNQKVIEYCKRAINDVPGQPVYKIILGQYQYLEHDYEACVETLESAVKELLEQKKNETTDELKSMAMHQLSSCYYNLGRYKECWQIFDQILSENQQDALALNNYAYFLAEQDMELEKAEKMSSQSLSNDPLNSTYLDTYAYILLKRKKYNEALFVMERCMDNAKPVDRSSELYEHYGDILFHVGQVEKALVQWEQAYKLSPHSKQLKWRIENKKAE
ncbi:MAG: tetratricopeptide repeat protein [Bacteroidales bacterium]|nr:tetratricopeptide repeat protein [Bacteroidales bacterium]